MGRRVSDTLAHAIAYVRRGWPVFPCRPSDKTPATRNGFHDATCDDAQVRAWFAAGDHNIGIACGDRLAVLDIDPRHDSRGMPLDALLADLGPLPADAPRVATGGGGIHVYFAGPHRTDTKLGGREWAEIRGQGAYVIAPPSIHASGRQYVFTTMPAGSLPGLPARFRSTRPTARPPEQYASLASSRVVEGGRHNALRSLVGHVLRRGVDPRVAWPLIESWSRTHLSPPLPPEQVERLFVDIAQREQQRRGASQ